MKSEPTMLFDERVVILFRLGLMTEGTEVSDFVLNNDLLVFVYLSVSMSHFLFLYFHLIAVKMQKKSNPKNSLKN